MALIPVVNDRDEVIEFKERSECGPEDITRVAGLWMVNSNNEVLIQKRALSKKYNPGKWQVSVAGTVEKGETYLSNILKETQEEAGFLLTDKDVVFGSKELVCAEHRYFRQMFFARVDVSITQLHYEENAIEEIRFVSLMELQRWLMEKPEDFSQSFPMLLEELEAWMKA